LYERKESLLKNTAYAIAEAEEAEGSIDCDDFSGYDRIIFFDYYYSLLICPPTESSAVTNDCG